MRLSTSFSLVSLLAVSLSAQIEVASDGKVGIGTASPAVPLQVNGSAGVIISAFNATNPKIQVDANGVGKALLTATTTNGYVGTSSNIPFNLFTNDTVRATIDTAGNLGIGTASPGYFGSLLQVQKDQDATTRAIVANGNSGSSSASEWVLNAYGNSWALGMGSLANNSNAFYIGKDVATGTPAAKYFSITTGGNVGIGTAAPGTRLEVKGDEVRIRAIVSKTDTTARGLLRLTSDDTPNTNNLELLLSLQGAASGGTRNAQIQAGDFGYGWASLALNPHGGNVGVGTTTPSYRLQVAGTVRATSFISDTTTYADFVFKPDYSLAPLSEVEAHIKAHGHLPDVPSESQVAKEGIDLAAMQVKLLQKVEELTLHAIAQEKRANDQARVSAEQRQLIQDLQAQVARLSR
jgi:hypothetical protein